MFIKYLELDSVKPTPSLFPKNLPKKDKYYSINILKNPSQDPFTLAEGGIFWTFPNRFGNKVLRL